MRIRWEERTGGAIVARTARGISGRWFGGGVCAVAHDVFVGVRLGGEPGDGEECHDDLFPQAGNSSRRFPLEMVGTIVAAGSEALSDDESIDHARLFLSLRGTHFGTGRDTMRSNQTFVLALACLAVIGIVNVAGADEPTKAPPLPKGKQVLGTMQIGDKTYKLEYVVAYNSKVFDEERPSLLFSDKPIDVKKLQAAIQKDGTDDSFNTFQTHVKVTFDQAGKPAFCNAYGDNNSISVSGGGLQGDLKIENGQARGNAALPQDPESTRKRSFSIQFNAPLLKIAATAPKADSAKTAANPATPGKPAKGKAEKETKPAAALKAVSVFDLPMPKDAQNIERKELVGHIKYTSANSVKSVVSLLQKKLAEQGWQTEDEDFNAPASSILHRKRGEASLTIFVKPATPGCTVTIMSEGLNWDEPPAE